MTGFVSLLLGVIPGALPFLAEVLRLLLVKKGASVEVYSRYMSFQDAYAKHLTASADINLSAEAQKKRIAEMRAKEEAGNGKG